MNQIYRAAVHRMMRLTAPIQQRKRLQAKRNPTDLHVMVNAVIAVIAVIGAIGMSAVAEIEIVIGVDRVATKVLIGLKK
jgi:hypothetical protein